MREKIIEYVKQENLASTDRDRDTCYRRFYLYNILRMQGLSYQAIGKIFNKDHATVMYGVKTHDNLTSVKDWIYIETTEKERLMFDKLSPEYDLIDDILKCHSLENLKKIKFRIRNNLYKNLPLHPHFLDDGEEM